MVCPVCGSQAVVADTRITNYVDKVQEGTDPYDLIVGPEARSRCLACGHVFAPSDDDRETSSPNKKS